MNMPANTVGDLKIVTHRGLSIQLSPDSFLNREQASYALRQVWIRCGGASDYVGPPLVTFQAATHEQVKSLFALNCGDLPWLSTRDLASEPQRLDAGIDRLPAVLPQAQAEQEFNSQVYPFDLITFAFLMLSRWEESHWITNRDHHRRTPLQDMLSYRQGFHDRPVVDEWCLVLRAQLSQRCAASVQPLPQSTLRLTTDVDRPLRYPDLWRILRGAAGEMLSRSHSPRRTVQALFEGWHALRQPKHDPYALSLHRLAQLGRELDATTCFYFMTAQPSQFDEGYDLHVSPYRELFQSLRHGSVEIGWHPGYLAAEDPSRFAAEKSVMDQLVEGASYGGRHHFLRWQAGVSWEQWSDHGLVYDSSLGFAEAVGFRCGTAHPFPAFSFKRNQELSLVERPMHLMDVALEHECRSGADPRILVRNVLERVQRVGGEAVVLIHNCYDASTILSAIVDGMRAKG